MLLQPTARQHNGKPVYRLVNSAPEPGTPLVPYESAAMQSPRMRRWIAPAVGPNRALNYSLPALRSRSRQSQRNNPWLWRAIDALITNEVGVGITLRSDAQDKTFRDAATALWAVVQNQLDPSYATNFGGIQEQAVRGRRVAGEVFIRRRWLALTSGLAVPFQIQVLEAEHVPETFDAVRPNGNRISAGIEYNRRSQRVAIWVYPHHPHDRHMAIDTGLGTLVRIPIRDIIHHYSPIRPGQDRGEPEPARSLLAADTLDKYLDAELRRKETRAPFTAAIERDWPDEDESPQKNPATGKSAESDGADSIESGTLIELGMGEKIHLFDGDPNANGIWEYARGVLLQVAAGAGGVPYELVSGDWRNVNDRQIRALLNEFHRAIEAAQDHLLSFQLCRRVWDWYIDAAVLAGKLEAPGYEEDKTPWRTHIARPHGWPFVHFLQDAQTKKLLIEAGLTSRQEEREKMPGPGIEEIDKQRKEDQDREERLEIKSGSGQTSEPDPSVATPPPWPPMPRRQSENAAQRE